MYQKILLFSIFLAIIGCSGRSYPPKEKENKESYIIDEGRLPTSVHETIGRYRKEIKQ